MNDIYKWLNNYLETHQDKCLKAQLFLNWGNLIEEKVATYTRPIHLNKKGILYLKVKDSMWLTEFQNYKTSILKKIQKKYPQLALKDIHLKLDSNLIIEKKFSDHTSNHNPPLWIKEKPTKEELEQRIVSPQIGIKSCFLNKEDEFQFFDLY